jgi:hypothetical protein
MSPTIPIPCPNCGLPVRVELRQAGQELTCRGCSQPFAAPKLRDLKRLSEAESPPTDGMQSGGPDRPFQRPVHRRKMSGALFSAGLGLALLFGIAGYSLHRYARGLEPAMTELEREAAEDQVYEQSNVNDLYAIWKELFDQRLIVEWKESAFRGQIRQGQILRTVATCLFVVAGCGVLTMLAALAGVGGGRKRAGRS